MSGKAYVLMTAMPPTVGHWALIEFALALTGKVEVIVATQPGEPYEFERVRALRQAANKYPSDVNINHIRKELPQEPTPESESQFWDMWADFLRQFGIESGNDYIVSSEMYGQKLAEITGTAFIPYDLERSIVRAKATDVRVDPLTNFSTILPEFQPLLRKTITIFGAESTGKTTLSKVLATKLRGWWLPEWARPYLENVGSEITEASMTAIWEGQRALQKSAQHLKDRPFIIQDTDLFSTLGYWQYSEWQALQRVPIPYNLAADSSALASDLYLITPSNIPFEHDQLRYGGDHREIPDEKWIHLCDVFGLNYRVLSSTIQKDRLDEARNYATELFYSSAGLDYVRQGREYQKDYNNTRRS
jgi:HTH-type transcriptional regulator, transcriptional repressor of NAD biosynthesis genes